MFLAALAIQAGAQTITVRLINGKTGKAMKNKNVKVTFWWEDPASRDKDKRKPLGNWGGTDVYIGKQGTGHIDIPQKATLVEIGAGSKIGKEPFRVPYFDCTESTLPRIPVADVLARGFIPVNSCNKNLKIRVAPGEIIYLGDPIPWWEPDFE
jgi:hypothetical protein